MLKRYLRLLLMAVLCTFGKAHAQNTIFSYNNCPGFLQYSPVVTIYTVPPDSVLSIVYKQHSLDPKSRLFQQPKFTIARERLDSLLQSKAVPAGHYVHVALFQNNVSVTKYHKQSFQSNIVDMGVMSLLQVTDMEGDFDNSVTVRLNNKEIPYNKDHRAFVLPYIKSSDTISIKKDDDIEYYYTTVHVQKRAKEDNRKYVEYVQKKYNGYVVTNKPKYLPGDTVKWKAYLLDQFSGLPVKDNLVLKISEGINYRSMSVSVANTHKKNKRGDKSNFVGSVSESESDFDEGYGYQNYILNKAIEPVRPGVYFGEFVMVDSMDIDETYNLVLTGRDGQRLHTQFVYEDYLLNDMRVKVKGDASSYQQGDSIRMYIYASTANNLPMMEGKVEMTIIPNFNPQIDGKKIFPDTLFHEEVTVDPSGETVITAPSNNFPNQSGEFLCKITAVNSNFERKDTTFSIQYMAVPYYLRTVQTGNVVKVEMIQNKKSVKGTGWYFKNSLRPPYKITYPFEIIVGPYDHSLTFTMDSMYTNKNTQVGVFYLQQDQLTTASDYVKDTAYLMVSNPQKSFVRFSIYCGDKFVGLTQSSGDTVLKVFSSTGETVTVKAFYTWRNHKQRTFTICKYDKDIHIDVHKKDLVYPGQKDSISIRLTDMDGKPVSNTNLTVLAFNNQFAEDFVPELPYAGILKPGATEDTTRMMNQLSPAYVPSFKLADRSWVKAAAADTVFLYRQILLNKRSNTWIRYRLGKDAPAQMSVHIMENTAYAIPEVIYVDGIPVFYRLANRNSANNHNGFRIPQGNHRITVRMQYNEYTINDVNIIPGTALALFINGDMDMPASIQKRKVEPQLSAQEKYSLTNAFIFFRPEYNGDAVYSYDPFGNKIYNYGYKGQPAFKEYMNNNMIYFQQNGRTYVSGKDGYYSNGLQVMGPFTQGQPITFYQFNNTKQIFNHEPSQIFVFRDGMIRVEKTEATQYFDYMAREEYWPQLCYTAPSASLLLDTLIARITTDTLYPTFDIHESRTNRNGANNFAMKASIRGNHYNDYTYSTNGLSGAYLVLSNKTHRYETLRADLDGNTYLGNMQPGNYNIELIYREKGMKIKGRATIKKDSCTHISLVISSYVLRQAITENQKEVVVEYKNTANSNRGKQTGYGNGTISGTATDENGEPIIGALITVFSGGIKKGGAVTDIDGNYVIGPLAAGIYDVLGTYSSYKSVRTKNVSVSNDGEARVNINFSPNVLQEVVVVYKKPLISNTGKVNSSFDASDIKNAPTRDLTKLVATSAGMVSQGRSGTINAGGSRGGNTITMLDGVMIRGGVPNLSKQYISEAEPFVETAPEFMASGKTQAFISESMQNQLMAAGIRNNFRDYAIWEPNLWTDKNGETHFNVTYPDNITGWKTYVLAMNEHGFAGRALQMTHAFKPLSAQLSVPRFLRYGDTVIAIGKISNYTQEAFNVQTSFLKDRKELGAERITVNNIKVASLEIAAPIQNSVDTTIVTATYSLQADNGFVDGEEKKIPIYFTGTTQSKGIFAAMPGDTVIYSKPDSDKIFTGNAFIMIDGSVLDVMLREIENLKEYPYGCVEQLTTKLLAISYEETVKKLMGVTTVNNAGARDSIIKQLAKKQNRDGSFGWWKNEGADIRITNYVINTMSKINDDHKLDAIINDGLQFLAKDIKKQDRYNFLHTLKTLSDHNMKMDYSVLLKSLPDTLRTQHDSFIVVSIKKQQGLPYRTWLDSLIKNAHVKHGLSWGLYSYDWYANDLSTTLMAYKLIENDSVYSGRKDGIMQFLMNRRKEGYYRNTAESGQVLTTILPGLVKNVNSALKDKHNKVSISGTINKEVKEFPAKMMSRDLNPNFAFTKTGIGPAYVSVVYNYMEAEPKIKDDVFEVKSHFVNGKDTVNELKAGINSTLLVTVKCDTAMEYVMIEIPIPAGCVQAGRNPYNNYIETNRDNFKDKTVIYCSRMSRGTHTFTVPLEVRYKGSFNMNPTRASMMYYTDKYGNNEVKRIKIK